jgi:glycosyltransferase involved in cell wall biosynthesis
MPYGESDLIRTIWRHLPAGVRRPLAHATINLFAPGLPVPAAASFAPEAPVVVVGFLTSASGLGQASRLAYRAFELQGREVLGIDLSRFFFETKDVVALPHRDGRGHRGPGRVLININAPYMAYVFNLLGRGFLAEKHVTGYWAWESPCAPGAWREGLRRAHALATPSAFVADAIRALGHTPPIVVAPHPVMLEALPTIPRRTQPISPEVPFTVAFSFNSASGFERKNPLALIAAFKAAFPDRHDVSLRILASNIEHYADGRALIDNARAGDARIAVTFEAVDRDAYWRWYGTPDLYASLHRAEGFGLTIAESMALGVPVLATRWSANTEFMTEVNAIPIHHRLVPIRDAQQKYAEEGVWAEADVQHAAAMMRRAFDNPAWLATIAASGAADALRLFSSFHPWGKV